MLQSPNFDRFLKIFTHESSDYVPFYEHYADVSIMEAILGRPRPQHSESSNSNTKIMTFYADFYSKLGFDCLPFETELHLFQLGGQFGGGRGWVDHNVATISNLEEFEEYPWPDVEHAFDFNLIEAAKNVLPEGMKMVCGVAGGVQEYVLSLVGLKRFSVAVRNDRPFVAKIFEKIGSLIREIDQRIAEYEWVGALRMGDDMGYKTGTLLNPKTIREFVLPQHKQIVEVAHKHNKPFILHSCGNLTEIIDELIDDVKIDGWHSFQDIILPVVQAKQKYGDRVALLGGVDLDKLCRSTPAELETYCKEILTKCKIRGGFAFGTGNSVADYVPLENYKLLLEFGRKYGQANS